MTDLATEITEFLTGERRPMKPDELTRLVVQEASYNPQWSRVSYEQWTRAIDEAVKRGLLVLNPDKTVWLAPPAVEPPKPKQLGLFDE